MKGRDINQVKDGWLTDESVNFSIGYLCAKSEVRDKFLPYISLFYTKLIEGEAENSEIIHYDLVRRWGRRIDIFTRDILLFPIHGKNHWSLVVVIRPACLVRKLILVNI